MRHRRSNHRVHKIRRRSRDTTTKNIDWLSIALPVALFVFILVIILASGNLLTIPGEQPIPKTTLATNYEGVYRSGVSALSPTALDSLSFSGEGSTTDYDIISRAKSISIPVPSKGNSPIGSKESMQEMYTWQLDSGYQLIRGFTDIASLLGIQDQDYIVNMQTSLDRGMGLANKNWNNK
ncbi:MAG: hypothetical protein NTV68_15145 [Methanomicrobiales archaeon]|nr:hypothetical protein [Methanomicrobiales archaeon]